MRFIIILFKLLLIALFGVITYYILLIETEKYESSALVMVKDLKKEQSISPLGELLMTGGSEGSKDAKLLEIYLKSPATFLLVNQDFNLTDYYSSKKIDLIHRLDEKSFIRGLQKNKRNLLKSYNNDLKIFYDELSSTLQISFSHANPKTAKKIVEKLIVYATKALNRFEKKSTSIVLNALKEQEEKKHKLFMKSLKKLLAYQSEHHTLDPKIDVASKNTILASLESQLIQKEVEYNSKAQYLNVNSSEMNMLAGDISFVKKSIHKIKNEISGSENQKKLSVNISNFELLKSEVDFHKEMYRLTLVKLEDTLVQFGQQSKNLIIISKAEIAEDYTYPNKIKDIFSLFIIFIFIYGITSMILTIIRDHKD